jgi:hypothetical protein
MKDPGPTPEEPEVGAKWFDPADDIVTYLLSASISDWQPIEAATTATQPVAADDPALKALMLEYLNEAFYKDAAAQYFDLGIPPEMEGELKGAEKDLIVQPGQKLTDAQRLKYLGRKTIAKYGCFGCRHSGLRCHYRHWPRGQARPRQAGVELLPYIGTATAKCIARRIAQRAGRSDGQRGHARKSDRRLLSPCLAGGQSHWLHLSKAQRAAELRLRED